MGAVSTKPTRIAHYKLDLSGLAGRCTHKPKWWTVKDGDKRTRYRFQNHKPLEMNKHNGVFASKATAAYPYEMNKRLVKAFIQIPIKVKDHGHPSQAPHLHPGQTVGKAYGADD